jgi:hypothetical protein
MRSDPKPETKYSYLLRVWRVSSQPPRWQVSLRDARTGETFNFADLQQLNTFLDQRMTGAAQQDNIIEPTQSPKLVRGE